MVKLLHTILINRIDMVQPFGVIKMIIKIQGGK